MRKLILIGIVSLFATQAHAGGPRSLSLAATNASQQAAEQPASPPAAATQATQAPATTPPANVQTATTTPASAPPPITAPGAAPAQSTAAPAASTTEAAKPKRRQPSTEARVIRELHRHGIYW